MHTITGLIFFLTTTALIVLPVLVIGGNNNAGTKKLYEQTCTTSEDCDQALGLTCQARVCKCDPSGATVYSLSKNRCVGAAGRECLKPTISTNESLCVDNSLCKDYAYMHFCSCKEGFYAGQDGNCYAIARFGDSCIEENFSCGDTLSTGINCIDKKCRCLLGDSHQYYDTKEKRCISLAGGQCIQNYFNSCITNSYCAEINENVQGASFLIGHKCICSPEHSYTKNGQCLGRYGIQCDLTNPCNYDDYFGCLNGKCQCRNPLNEKFDEKTQKCTILVSSVCKFEDGPKCVENADCFPEKNNTKSRHGKCQCNSGFSTTPYSTCLLDINQKCDPNQCNHYNALTCINGTCHCIDSSLSYDKVSKSCVSLVGLPCGTVQLYENDVPPDQKKETTVLCESNASCSKISGSANGNSKRVCKAISTSSSTVKI